MTSTMPDSAESIYEKQTTLETMKQKIDNMTKTHHTEILKILKTNPNIKLNVNKSGVYVNLSYLDEETIEKINKYIHYIEDQEHALLTVEYQKEDFINEYFQTK